jgi:hypothetical protein
VRQLGREHAVETQVRVAREVNQQGHMAVRERGGDAPAAQRLKARPDVGPWVQLVPCLHQPISLVDRRVHATLSKQIAKRDPVKIVEVAPRPRALVDLGEDRPVAGAPSVGELLGVAVDPARAKRIGDP